MSKRPTINKDALSSSQVYVPVKLHFPVCIRNKDSTTYICFDDSYRFIRVDKDETNKETLWTYQMGIHYAWNKSRKPLDEEEYDAFFIEQIVKRNIIISREEFIEEVEKFGDKFEEYKNFVLSAAYVRMPEQEEKIELPVIEKQEEISFSLEDDFNDYTEEEHE